MAAPTTTTGRRGTGLATAVTAGVLACAACAGPAVPASPASASPAPTAATPAPSATALPSATAAPQPAGATPSEISQMVCGEARTVIEQALGAGTPRVETPTWTDHTYSCRYVYPAGSFTVSVKELSSWPETLAYFDGLGRTLGRKGALSGLGEGSFATTNGSVVARKDWKVLLVDDSALPARFGSPPIPPGDAALIVAGAIMGCWAGD